MGRVCGDLLSPCVCSIGRVARTRAARRLRFRGRGCIRAKRCIGIPCACLCSCPTQSASALGASISTSAEMTTAGEGNSVDPDGGRPLRKVVRRSLFAEWVPSAARISSDSAQQGGAELSDAAAVTDSVVQPQPTADRGAECSREQSLVRAAPGGGRTSRASSSRSVRADLARRTSARPTSRMGRGGPSQPCQSRCSAPRFTVSCCGSRWRTSMRPWTVFENWPP
jgi:hypothetical protein